MLIFGVNNPYWYIFNTKNQNTLLLCNKTRINPYFEVPTIDRRTGVVVVVVFFIYRGQTMNRTTIFHATISLSSHHKNSIHSFLEVDRFIVNISQARITSWSIWIPYCWTRPSSARSGPEKQAELGRFGH